MPFEKTVKSFRNCQLKIGDMIKIDEHGKKDVRFQGQGKEMICLWLKKQFEQK